MSLRQARISWTASGVHEIYPQPSLALKSARCFVEVITAAAQMTHLYDLMMCIDGPDNTLFVDLYGYMESDIEEPPLRPFGDIRGEKVTDPLVLRASSKSRGICLLLQKTKPAVPPDQLHPPSSSSTSARIAFFLGTLNAYTFM